MVPGYVDGKTAVISNVSAIGKTFHLLDNHNFAFFNTDYIDGLVQKKT